MTIKDVNIYKLEEGFTDLDKMYAHFKENKQGEKIHNETLKEHLELTLDYFYKIVKEKKLENVIENFEEELLKGFSDTAKDLFKEFLVNAVYMHDVGKSNPNFQYYKMKNKHFQSLNNKNTEHSLFSSVIYFNSYCEKIGKLRGEEEVQLLLLILMINSYAIARHHGYLKDFFEFYENGFPKAYKEVKEISKIKENNFYINYKGGFKNLTFAILDKTQSYNMKNKLFNILEKKETWKSVDLYIYSRFVFSLIVSSDFYATSEYETEKEIEELGLLDNVKEFRESYDKTKVSKSIKEYRDFKTGLINKCPFKENDINLLRSEIFLESEKNLLEGLKEKIDIFFLEAPTGSGKTNSSINLALTALEKDKSLNKLFYIFPFNTLVEQTKVSLDEVFGDDKLKGKISIVNSITAMTERFKEDSKVDYEKTLLARQFLHYPITLSTHVNLFNYLFGLNRDSVFPLTQLANSVVIIDEVQSYKNSIWTEIIIFLKKYSKLLNIKFIIMSATLPDLRELSNEKHGFKVLINNREKYFESPLFKNRVKVDYSLSDKELDLESLLENIRPTLEEDNKKIVIEFIKKKSALEFYEMLKNLEYELGKEVLLITGDDNRAERKRIINKVKGLDNQGNELENPNNNIILVATQVIEAGVDIDMDYGFKDISILDSEEQFLGRINRSCKKKGAKVYFFNIDDASSIYKNDLRKIKELTIENDEIRKILKNKDFSLFYKKVMDYLKKQNQRLDAQNIDDFRENSIKKLNYINVYERMKLIDERNQFSVFLNIETHDLNGKPLNGKKIWNDYKELIRDNNMDYAEKQVRLSKVKENMDYFIYTVSKINFAYNDSIGDLTYVEDGEKFFTNGKFNTKAVDGFDSVEFL